MRLLPLFLLLLLTACGSKHKPFNGVLKPSNVASQFFSVDPVRGGRMLTAHGTMLVIPAGAFATTEPVRIEIREVFTPAEILRSGLTTLSDGRPLRSRGMLYFQASTASGALEPVKPVKAFVPDKYADPDMRVFKGEMNTDSTVNWTDPQWPDTSRPAGLREDIGRGYALFSASCSKCHRVWKEGTGPALQGLIYRGPWKDPAQLLRWVQHPSRFMASNAYTQDLKNKYGSVMTGFPDLQADDLQDILAYINQAGKEETYPERPVVSKDSLAVSMEQYQSDTSVKGAVSGTDGERDCGSDTLYVNRIDTFEQYDSAGLFLPADTIGRPDTVNAVSIFDTEYKGIYRQGYDFNITQNGWYNIDAFLKTDPGVVEPVALTAELRDIEDVPANVYVLVPTERVMQAHTEKKGMRYEFRFSGDGIPLPLGTRAIVLAVTSQDKKVKYGISEFIVQKAQLVEVSMKDTTPEGLINLLYTERIDGVDIKAIEKQTMVRKKECDTTKVVNMPNLQVFK